MKIILLVLGVTLIVFGLFLSFGIILSRLKEGNESFFGPLTFPLGILIIGLVLYVKGKRIQKTKC